MNPSRKQLLQQIYDFQQNNSCPLSISAQDVSKFDISYLKDNGYICIPFSSIGAYHLSLTEKGESFVENGFTMPHPSTPATFNFSGATLTNSVVGANVSDINYSINTEAAFSELKELILSKQEADQEQLQNLISTLETIKQSNQPVKKGILIQFSNLLNKYSDLIVPVGKILIGIFTSNV